MITADDAVARWAAKPISIGGQHQFTPYVLGPSGIPEVTDEVQARENPELAVLSALAHGRDANSARAAEIARVALKVTVDLDAERGSMYGDSINVALGEAARLALKSMDIRKYEYKTEFARHHFARGQAVGEARGCAALIARLLAARFGRIDAAVSERIERATLPELELIGERLLTAASLEEALGPE